MPVLTDTSAMLKIPVLNTPPKSMNKKSVTDPKRIRSQILAIPPPAIAARAKVLSVSRLVVFKI